ncbi:MAG: DUF1573 domain-containing protein [Anaerolineales bacterium]|nr:DUF1573 domain-containing protein [Anaerolineales bacterium]
MSKKQRKQKQNNWLLPLIVLAGILLITAAFFFAGQSRDDGGTPLMAVDQQKIDYGDVKFDTPKTFAVKVTNIGDGTLRFLEEPYIEVLEGC